MTEEHTLAWAERQISRIEAQIAPSPETIARQRGPYLFASLAATALFGLVFLRHAFSSNWMAALDTNQHIYWMRRFLDPGLFPNDPHTDYFQSVAPIGYTWLYQGLALLGLDPVDASKLMPLALALVTAYFCYRLVMRLFPVPLAAFAATFLVSAYAWRHEDLTTGCPRGFIYPLLLGFLDALAARHAGGLVLAVAATAVFYPQYVLVEFAILGFQLLRWEGGPRWGAARQEVAAYAAAAAAGLAGLAVYAAQTHRFGPVVTQAEALTMPEFLPGGFRTFFLADPVEYWIDSFSSGYQAYFSSAEIPALMAIAVAFPFVVRQPGRFPLVKRLGGEARVLATALLGPTALFFLAHAALFYLYQPARYTVHPTGVVAAIAAGITLVIAADTALAWGRALPRLRLPSGAVAGLLGVALVATGFATRDLPNLVVFYRGLSPGLYAHLGALPKDILVASLANEADNIGIFARRKVLISGVLNPYHLGYWRPVQQAYFDTIAAQYATDLGEVADFLRRHRVTHLLLDQDAFEPRYVETNKWLRQYAQLGEAVYGRMARGERFALEHLPPRWISYESRNHVLVRAGAIIEAADRPEAMRPEAKP